MSTWLLYLALVATGGVLRGKLRGLSRLRRSSTPSSSSQRSPELPARSSAADIRCTLAGHVSGGRLPGIPAQVVEASGPGSGGQGERLYQSIHGCRRCGAVFLHRERLPSAGEVERWLALQEAAGEGRQNGSRARLEAASGSTRDVLGDDE